MPSFMKGESPAFMLPFSFHSFLDRISHRSGKRNQGFRREKDRKEVEYDVGWAQGKCTVTHQSLYT